MIFTSTNLLFTQYLNEQYLFHSECLRISCILKCHVLKYQSLYFAGVFTSRPLLVVIFVVAGLSCFVTSSDFGNGWCLVL